MSAGIYLIINSITDKFYVGRAIRTRHRWITHKSILNKNKHPNEYLQAKIGKSNSKPRLSTENMKKPKSEEHKRSLSLARTGFKHSEEDRLKRSISAKSKSSWTHENGNKCKCDECRARRNEYYRNKKYKRDRKTV